MAIFSTSPFVYDFLKPGEEDEVIDLILTTFNEFIAPGYSEERVTEFCDYANTKGLKSRAAKNHCTLVAKKDKKIIGAMEIRENNHISLFFVEKGFQKNGVGKDLLKHALKKCFGRNHLLEKITVNASPNAVGAYKTMGFKAEGPEQCINGIQMVPMSFKVR